MKNIKILSAIFAIAIALSIGFVSCEKEAFTPDKKAFNPTLTEALQQNFQNISPKLSLKHYHHILSRCETKHFVLLDLWCRKT